MLDNAPDLHLVALGVHSQKVDPLVQVDLVEVLHRHTHRVKRAFASP
jgi:hypothetical protein